MLRGAVSLSLGGRAGELGPPIWLTRAREGAGRRQTPLCPRRSPCPPYPPCPPCPPCPPSSPSSPSPSVPLRSHRSHRSPPFPPFPTVPHRSPPSQSVSSLTVVPAVFPAGWRGVRGHPRELRCALRRCADNRFPGMRGDRGPDRRANSRGCRHWQCADHGGAAW